MVIHTFAMIYALSLPPSLARAHTHTHTVVTCIAMVALLRSGICREGVRAVYRGRGGKEGARTGRKRKRADNKRQRERQ